VDLRPGRTIAIGDIHGCAKALDGLLEAINLTLDDHLVFLGDYVDRGPDSRGVLERLLSLKEECQLTLLRGNHEILFQSCLQEALDIPSWIEAGGRPTLSSYGGTLAGVPESHIALIEQCVPYLETDRCIFVHANYLPAASMPEQPDKTLYWEHLTERFPGPHVSGKTVFLGHTPQIDGEVLDAKHVVCLDTYCFGGKWLTAMDVDSRDKWQVSSRGLLRGSALRSIQNWTRRTRGN
jgi:serine/threonine protein phosphatase 1